MRVLLVADASWVRNQIRASLPSGVELVELSKPRLLIDRYEEERPDVVIVDLQTGSMGGMATTRELKSAALLEGWGHVPIIMLLDRSADEFIAKRAGADAWLVKPITTHEFRTALQTVGVAAVPEGA